MKMKLKHLPRQSGFAIGAVLLVIALIGVVAAAIAAATRGQTNTNTTTQQDTTNASALMYQAATLDGAFSRMVANGQAATGVTFDTTATTGLFNPTTGTSRPANPPATAFTSGVPGTWTYNKLVKLNGVGTAAAADYVVALTGLTSTVCAAINTKLVGAATIPNSTAASTAWAAGTAVDDSAVAGVNSDVCVKGTDNVYVYAHAVFEN